MPTHTHARTHTGQPHSVARGCSQIFLLTSCLIVAPETMKFSGPIKDKQHKSLLNAISIM